jgi:hypothetical protein
MIKLDHDSLSFTFPEIAHQVISHIDRRIEDLLPRLLEPAQRTELVRELESYWGFQRLPVAEQEVLRTRAKSLPADEVCDALRKAASGKFGLAAHLRPELTIEFERTLRIPDDGKVYPLPAGLGQFPLRSVDDFSETVPASYATRGEVLMPMYQSEALWINFSTSYPFAVKVAAGKINAVSGEPWGSGLQRRPQNYLVLPEQPWLDGFSVGEGFIRQFVAMPLGAGYSVEEQLTGNADVGGIQLQVYPMSAESYYRDEVAPSMPSSLRELLPWLFEHLEKQDPNRYERRLCCQSPSFACLAEESMGLGAGGRMRQEIYQDDHEFSDWDKTQTHRCFVHLCNSLVWRQVTGANPPHPPLTSQEYKRAGVPWFDYYRDDLKPLKGSGRLAGVKSVAQLGKEKNGQPLPENSSISPDLIVQYGNTRRPAEIREFSDV